MRALARFAALWLVAIAVAQAAAPIGAEGARHLLARAAFGGSPTEVGAFATLTREDAVARLLAGAARGATTAPPGWVSEPIPLPRDLAAKTPEERRILLQEANRRTIELRGWWVGEMLATPAPLVERMTLFWHNHFVSSQQKVRAPQRLYRQNELFRAHALGNFGALLHAVARDPAMAIYLDTTSNRRDRPNENFAREVMELFTLGEGHYTEHDIREAARAFTGWTIDPESGELRFFPARHDAGVKTLLGQTGTFNAEQVIDILLAQPATAEFIVGKLWREFVSLEPQPAEVKRIAARFRASRYDLRVALGELLRTEAFWAPEHRGALLKSPVDLVIGTMRQFSIEVANPAPLAMAVSSFGQVLFAPPNVRGWPGGEAWINTSSLLARKQFLERVFRADEMAPDADAMRQRGEGAAARTRMVRAIDSLRFDAPRWFSEVDRVGGLNAQRVTLAIDPVVPIATVGPVRSRAEIAQLVLDAAYQVK